jgi:hypothetical protein
MAKGSLKVMRFRHMLLGQQPFLMLVRHIIHLWALHLMDILKTSQTNIHRQPFIIMDPVKMYHHLNILGKGRQVNRIIQRAQFLHQM